MFLQITAFVKPVRLLKAFDLQPRNQHIGRRDRNSLDWLVDPFPLRFAPCTGASNGNVSPNANWEPALEKISF